MQRLFFPQSLKSGYILLQNRNDIHYLINVMRKKLNDKIGVFNENDGEYTAQISSISNKQIELKIIEQIRTTEETVELILIFAPIKAPRINFLLEKATELGVTKLIPIRTKHSVIDKINIEKWQIYVKEAAEQCERLSIPEIAPLVMLEQFLKTWDNSKQILLCNEKEKSLHLRDAPKSSAIMIGPEGGFSENELNNLQSQEFITSAHLGPRILRAETASIVGLTLLSY